MVLAVFGLQIVGLAVLYLVLRRYLDRTLRRIDEAPELRSRVAELTAEMNATAERNITLLEDRVKRLDESLREADRHASRSVSEVHQVAPPAPAGGAGTREARVMRLRKLGFSSAVIADRLATSQGEVELILNLAADRGPVPPRPDHGTATAPATRT